MLRYIKIGLSRFALACLLSLCALSCVLVTRPRAAEAAGTPGRVYQISEADMNALETRLTMLETRAIARKNQLSELENELTIAQRELEKSRAELTATYNSLTNANKYLNELKLSEQKTRKRIKAQRNAYICASAALLIAYVTKR